MKKYISNISLLLFVLITAVSCTEEIPLDLDDSYNRLVVEAYLSTDTTAHEVVLSKSTSYFDPSTIEYVSNADVYIENSDKSVKILLTESSSQIGHYYTPDNSYGVVNETYTLHINDVDIDDNGDFEEYTAMSQIKEVIYLDSISAVYRTVMGEQGFTLYGSAQEPATVGDYYMWRYYVNNVLSTDTLRESIFQDDAIFNGNYLADFEMAFIQDAVSGDTLRVESQSITKEYYEFVISFMLETEWSAGAFGGPPANIKTNISNGAIGYFKTSATSYIEIILP